MFKILVSLFMGMPVATFSIYLFYSLANASFDLGYWDGISRGLCAFSAFTVGCLFSAILYSQIDRQKYYL